MTSNSGLPDWIPSAGEISIVGIYIPSLLVYACIGFICSYGLSMILRHRTWSRHIWHLPLFFVSLWVLLTFGLGLILYPTHPRVIP